MIQNLTCSSSSSLLDAMHIINENSLGVCFVIDEFNALKGVVTDGDIRRAIMKNKALNSLLGEIANTDFVFGLEGEPIEELISKINKNDYL